MLAKLVFKASRNYGKNALKMSKRTFVCSKREIKHTSLEVEEFIFSGFLC